MSDPAFDGYQCHGMMRGVEWRGVYDGVSAWVCPVCGVWRHALHRDDPRRDRVEALMDAHVPTIISGPSAEVR